MKKLFTIFWALLWAFSAAAQFKNTNGTAFSYSTGLAANEVFVTGVPGVTNHNLASSNLIAFATAAGGTRATNTIIAALENSPLARGAYFVDAAYGSDTNTGKLSAPWATISNACYRAAADATIYVAAGTYVHPITRGGVTFVLADGANILVPGSVWGGAILATNDTGQTEYKIIGGVVGDSEDTQSFLLYPGNKITLQDTRIVGQAVVYYNGDGSFGNRGKTQIRAKGVNFSLPIAGTLVDIDGPNNGGTNRGYFEFTTCQFNQGHGLGAVATSTNGAVVFINCESAVVEAGPYPITTYGTNLINPAMVYP